VVAVAPELVELKPSERLRQLAAPVWDQILTHPYLQDLKAGTLPLDTFRFYVQQDWLYLQEFTRAGAIIAGRIPDARGLKFMLTWVEPLVGMEYHFHRAHAAELGLDFDRIDWEMNEANWAYSRHMLAAAHGGSPAEGLAAMLPCPHVYAHVGAVLRDGPLPPNPMYADWIDFYAPGKMSSVDDRTYDRDARIIGLTALFDELASGLDPAAWARCERNYLISSRYEWWFWDTAYRKRTWPV
jgi:thiaminase (transcriptional activator TenA)